MPSVKGQGGRTRSLEGGLYWIIKRRDPQKRRLPSYILQGDSFSILLITCCMNVMNVYMNHLNKIKHLTQTFTLLRPIRGYLRSRIKHKTPQNPYRRKNSPQNGPKCMILLGYFSSQTHLHSQNGSVKVYRILVLWSEVQGPLSLALQSLIHTGHLLSSSEDRGPRGSLFYASSSDPCFTSLSSARLFWEKSSYRVPLFYYVPHKNVVCYARVHKGGQHGCDRRRDAVHPAVGF